MDEGNGACERREGGEGGPWGFEVMGKDWSADIWRERRKVESEGEKTNFGLIGTFRGGLVL